MASETDSVETRYAYIVHTPGFLGGEARIEGHRIRVRDIAVARNEHGFSAEQIATEVYPNLTLAQVYSALAYFEDHREEIVRAAEAELHAINVFRDKNSSIVRDMRPEKE